MRVSLFTAAVALGGSTFLSFETWQTPASRPTQQATISAGPDLVSSADRPTDLQSLVDVTFDMVAINLNERVTVHCPAPLFEPSDVSVLASQHLFRAIFPDREGKIDRRLLLALRDLATAANTRVIELVSAYRRPSWRGDHNYHVRGQAADIRIPGMSARTLRDLAKSLGIKGVGYYPTSKMVHVDVRETPYFWTDWSPPTFTR